MKTIKSYESDAGYEELQVYINDAWTCEIDGKEVPLAIAVRITDMYEATGDDEFKDCPYLVGFEIIARDPHISISKDMAGDEYEGERSDYYDVMSYCGGVPVDHLLLDQDMAKDFLDNLKAKDGVLVSHKLDFGTIAAQRGPGSVFTYPKFKNLEACEEYIKTLIPLAKPLMMTCGFILDRPINMAGNSGWETITTQVEGI